MKSITKILMSIFVAVALLSCNNDEQLGYGDNDCYLPIEDMEIHPLGESFTLEFRASELWQVDYTNNTNADWIKIADGDSGLVKFTIKPYLNTKNSIRTATVKFCAKKGSKLLDSFKITQHSAFIHVDDSPIEFDWNTNGYTEMFNVESSVEWEVVVENDTYTKDWLTINGEYVNNSNPCVMGTAGKVVNSSLQIGAPANNYNVRKNSSRVKIVPIRRDAEGNRVDLDDENESRLTRYIDVSQDFKVFTVHEGDVATVKSELESADYSIEKFDELRFSELGSNYLADGQDASGLYASKIITIAIEDGCSYEDPSVDVFSFTPTDNQDTTKTNNGRAVTLKEYRVGINTANPSLEERVKIINISMDDDGTEYPPMSLSLIQNPYLFKVVDSEGNSVDNASFTCNGEEKKFTLKTNGPRKLPDTLTSFTIKNLSEDTDIGDLMFALTPNDRNMSLDNDVEEKILFSTGNDNLSHSLEFVAVQAKFNLDIKVLKDGEELNNLELVWSDTNEYDVHFVCSAGWEFNPIHGGTWLTINDMPVYGDDNAVDKTISIQAQKNYDVERVEQISFISKEHRAGNHKDYERTITITQQAYLFNLNINEETISSGDIYELKLGGKESSFDINVECYEPESWMADCEAEWISISKREKDNKLVVKVKSFDNESESREAIIEFYPTHDHSATRHVKIVQTAGEADE